MAAKKTASKRTPRIKQPPPPPITIGPPDPAEGTGSETPPDAGTGETPVAPPATATPPVAPVTPPVVPDSTSEQAIVTPAANQSIFPAQPTTQLPEPGNMAVPSSFTTPDAPETPPDVPKTEPTEGVPAEIPAMASRPAQVAPTADQIKKSVQSTPAPPSRQPDPRSVQAQKGTVAPDLSRMPLLKEQFRYKGPVVGPVGAASPTDVRLSALETRLGLVETELKALKKKNRPARSGVRSS